MSGPEMGKPRVLVADDHESNRVAFRAVLEKDFDVVLASSGSEAIIRCDREDFDVIVLDVRMPGMDGFETAQILRRHDRTTITPIIFASAFDQTLVQMMRGYVAGATDFLFSPVDPDLLRLKVGTYAQIHRRHEELRRKVDELNVAIHSLHEELSKRGVAATAVKVQIENLKETARELGREASREP
jgi:PleD family two-component response regulator